MTNIEKRVCAFLLACFMSISISVSSFAETVYAGENTDMEVSKNVYDENMKKQNAQEEDSVQATQLENGTLTEQEGESVSGDGAFSVTGTNAAPKSGESVGNTASGNSAGDSSGGDSSGGSSGDSSGGNQEYQFQVSEDEEGNKTAVITGYNGTDREIIIPSEVEASMELGGGADSEVKLTVTEIGENAFVSNERLTSVEIPRTVTGIQYAAFLGCSNLKNVFFEKGSALRAIGASAFGKNTSLEGFVCPDGLEYIGEWAFSDDKALTNVTFNGALDTIETRAFTRSGLQSVKIPDSMTFIDVSTFNGCEDLSSVILGKGIRRIGNSVFRWCGKLTEIALPYGLSSIGSHAFRDTGLKTIDIPDSVISIGGEAFEGCKDLNDVKLGDGLTEIGYGMFENSGVKDIKFGKKVKAIGDWAFGRDKSLTSIEIPSSVTDLQYSSFAYCSNLASITLPDTIEHLTGENFIGTAWYDKQPEGEVYAGKAFYYYKGEMPGNTALTIKAGTRCIAGRSCKDQPNLVSVTLPEGLISIGYAAFLETGLKSLYIPASVTWIDKGAVGYKRGGNIRIPYVLENCHVDTDFQIYGYAGTTAEAYAKSNGIKFTALNSDISQYAISGISDSYVYTGTELRPAVKVTKKGVEIPSDNYTVSYKDNTNPGTAVVTVTGKGYMSGSIKKTFTIKARPISQCTIEGISKPFDYTGKNIKPVIKVKVGSATIPSSNYVVSYANNKKIGKAKVTVKGKGALSGSVDKTFTIQPKLTVKKTKYNKTVGAASFKLGIKTSKAAKLKYSTNNKKVATVKNKKVSIKGSGKAEITVTATEKGIKASKKISITVKPKKMSVPSLKEKTGILNVSWKKASGITGYEIQYSNDKKFADETAEIIPVKKASAKKASIDELETGIYYVRIRACGRNNLKGDWSKAAKVKVMGQ